MFPKNMIVGLFVVCFLVKSSIAVGGEITEEPSDSLQLPRQIPYGEQEIPEESEDELKQPVAELIMPNVDEGTSSTRNVIPKLNGMEAKEWELMFNAYYQNRTGVSSPRVLQELIYKEFGAFATIRHLEKYLSLINLGKKCPITWEQLEKMKPIIAFLSQKKRFGELKLVDTNDPISKDSYIQEIADYENFDHMFETEEEKFEVLKIDPEVQFPIEATKFEEIMEMFFVSAELDGILLAFSGIDELDTVDSTISPKELSAFMKIGDPNSTENEINQMFKFRDLNGDKKIDFCEFVTMYFEDTPIRSVDPKRLASLNKLLFKLKLKNRHVDPTGRGRLIFRSLVVPQKRIGRTVTKTSAETIKEKGKQQKKDE